VNYPSEFYGSSALVAGEYQVEWRRAPLATPSAKDALLSILSAMQAPVIAYDAFTVD
jgi:hypothetical protein